jgi:hypothetical protein
VLSPWIGEGSAAAQRTGPKCERKSGKRKHPLANLYNYDL